MRVVTVPPFVSLWGFSDVINSKHLEAGLGHSAQQRTVVVGTVSSM